MGTFSAAFIQSTITATSLNPDALMLTNGTYNDTSAAKATEALPDWQERLAAYNIGIENRLIASFSRLHGNETDVDDDFVVTFTDGGSIVRNAIRANWPSKLASDLPMHLGLELKVIEDDVFVAVNENMESSMPGVFVVGDANS